MKLVDLIQTVHAVSATGQLEASAFDVTHDSRACRQGTVFVAIRGEKFDAHNFIPQALEQGAIAVVSERRADDFPSLIAPAWIQVSDARVALAHAAAAVYGHPSQHLKLVGITGTNGKTTTAHVIDAIIRASEGTSAIFGTISHRIGDTTLDAKHTTPEASDLQRMLKRAVSMSCQSAVMEVSSHSIELHRAEGLHFAVAVFTNLTRDHLDYHLTMENYFAAKRKLFDGSLIAPRASVINLDDEYGRKLVSIAKGNVLTYGLSQDADVSTTQFELTARGLAFTAATPKGQVDIRASLVGRPHVYNILAAIATGLALDFRLEDIASGIAACRSVAGRFEQVTRNGSQPDPFIVVVDYAHTDDALKNVLQTAREVAGASGRVISVFGCGGDRDRTKRAPMGEIAATLSDVTIVTSDNPRSEDPDAIIADIEVGLAKTARPYWKLPDRRDAIFRAIAEAQAGDVVVIAGKGHETYQILRDRTIHFDDHEIAREALATRA